MFCSSRPESAGPGMQLIKRGLDEVDWIVAEVKHEMSSTGAM